MDATVPSEFHYRVAWRSGGSHPGYHASGLIGGGHEFRGLVGILAARDPRRFDLRASLRDPFGEMKFRVYSQRSVIPVHALVDVSASMGFAGRGRKLDIVADFVAALGVSTYRTGDPLGVIACDDAPRPEFHEPLRWSKLAGQHASSRLAGLRPGGRSSEGLVAGAALCGARRGLVFLLSDFHFPSALLERVLAALGAHQVVPVVLWDAAEIALPRFGLASVRDPETGAERLLVLRPGLGEKLQRRFARHKASLWRRFAAFGARPLVLGERFDATAVTRHFHDG